MGPGSHGVLLMPLSGVIGGADIVAAAGTFDIIFICLSSI